MAYRRPGCRSSSKWWAVPTLLLFRWVFLTPLLPSLTIAQDSDSATSTIQSALQPQFIPPTPGTYTLPTIETVSDHVLLDSTGQQVSLFALTADKIAVISFMYTRCADVGGCPLAAAVLQHLDRLLSERPELAGRVVLLSVSFDPERDSPARLTEVRETLSPHTEWHFLTSKTFADLQPVLADFHQSVAKLWQEDGSWSGMFRHVLKVYLLDAEHNVRNIYSTGLFSAQLVLNDIETVILEIDKPAAASQQP
jgi:cytochrome c peroxidase